MKRIGVRAILLAAGIAAAVSCTSCSHHSASSGSAAAKRAKPGPEESYAEIISTFRRRMLEAPIGFVISDSTGRSALVGSNEISDKLIRPANDGEPYKAVITVSSESQYSLRRGKDDTDDTSKEDNAKSDTPSSLLNDGKKVGDVFDSAVPTRTATDTSKSHTTPHSADEVVARHPDTLVKDYELIYENGRWKLVTKLNRDTEQSIQNAFNDALRTQI